MTNEQLKQEIMPFFIKIAKQILLKNELAEAIHDMLDSKRV